MFVYHTLNFFLKRKNIPGRWNIRTTTDCLEYL